MYSNMSPKVSSVSGEAWLNPLHHLRVSVPLQDGHILGASVIFLSINDEYKACPSITFSTLGTGTLSPSVPWVLVLYLTRPVTLAPWTGFFLLKSCTSV